MPNTLYRERVVELGAVFGQQSSLVAMSEKLLNGSHAFVRKGVNTVERAAALVLGLRDHLSVLKALSGEGTKEILSHFPRVAYRYTLPYLSVAVPRERRVLMFKGHYQFINDKFQPRFLSRVLDGSLTLWSCSLNDMDIDISMSGPCLTTKHREGDLALFIKVNGQLLGKLGFSIVPIETLATPLSFDLDNAEGTHVLVIGQVQGQPGCFEQIKALTKACSDISPLDLLMAALAGFAASSGAAYMVGVSQHNNISFNDDTFSVSKGSFDYNGFWAKYGGVENADGDFCIRIPIADKPINLIKAKHRGRNLAKRAFKAGVTDSAKGALNWFVAR